MSGLRPFEEIAKKCKDAVQINPIRFGSKYESAGKEPVGTGGFATVYLIKNIKTDELCVLKRFKDQSEQARQEIINETSLSKVLECEYIVKVVELIENVKSQKTGQEAPKPELLAILDYMDGGSLTDIIENFSEQYSEEFCQYSLFMAAKGLK